MKKKLTSLILMFMCCVFSTLAQEVANTPINIDDLADGYYVIVAKSAKTNTNGNLLYCNGSTMKIDASQKENSLIGKVITDDNSNAYIWEIKRTSDGLQIRSYSANKWLNRYKNIGFAWDNESKVDHDPVEMGNSEHTFAIEKSDNDVHLTIKNGYKSGGLTMVKVYLTDSSTKGSTDDGQVGYRRNPGEDVLSFTFYQVEMPKQVSFVYKYVANGKEIKQQTVNATTYRAFPSVLSADFVNTYSELDDYVSPFDADQTFTISCDLKNNFDEDVLYYLQGNGKTLNSSLGTHDNGAYTSLNDAANDLWKVSGNPFDGYKFFNVSAQKYLKYNAGGWLTSKSVSLDNDGSVWYLRDNNSNGFALTATQNAAISSTSDFVNIGNNLSFGAANESGTFALTPATITLPLHYSAADDASFATTCLPYKVEVAEGQDGINAYAGKLNAEQTELEMTYATMVPANQGVIIRGGKDDTQVVLSLNTIAENAELDNDLLGTTSEISTEGILSFGRANGSGKVGFFRSTNATLPANRAYIQLNNNATQAIAMNFGDGTITCINNAVVNDAVNAQAPIYDLSGRRVYNVVKGGLYIQQGRKFIAK